MTLKVRNFKASEESLTLQSKFMGHSANITCLAQQSLRYIFSGAVDNTIIMWDLEKKTRIRTYTGHNDFLTSIYYDEKNDWLYSSCAGGYFYIWDAKNEVLEDSKKINDKGWISCFTYDEINELIILPLGKEKIIANDGFETATDASLELGDQHLCSILQHDGDLITVSFDGVFNILTIDVV